MCGACRAVDGILRGADRLQGEEQQHSGRGGEEEETTAKTLDGERCSDGPEQVPNGQDTGQTRQSIRLSPVTLGRMLTRLS